MRGQVVTHTVQDEPDTDDVEEKQETILEAMGLEFEETTEEDVRMIKSLLGDCRDKFYRAWRVKNIKTQKRFDEFVNKEHILFIFFKVIMHRIVCIFTSHNTRIQTYNYHYTN